MKKNLKIKQKSIRNKIKSFRKIKLSIFHVSKSLHLKIVKSYSFYYENFKWNLGKLLLNILLIMIRSILSMSISSNYSLNIFLICSIYRTYYKKFIETILYTPYNENFSIFCKLRI